MFVLIGNGSVIEKVVVVLKLLLTSQCSFRPSVLVRGMIKHKIENKVYSLFLQC